MKDIITIRGERELWIDFIHKTKKEKKKAWEVLNPFLRKYVSAEQGTRVLLILFPKQFVDQLLSRDDPDGFIQEAIEDKLTENKSVKKKG